MFSPLTYWTLERRKSRLGFHKTTALGASILFIEFAGSAGIHASLNGFRRRQYRLSLFVLYYLL
jgi:hypothetical protein